MNHRFTIKELQEWSDDEVLLMIVNNRRFSLDRYAPLAQRLCKIAGNLDGKINKERSKK